MATTTLNLKSCKNRRDQNYELVDNKKKLRKENSEYRGVGFGRLRSEKEERERERERREKEEEMGLHKAHRDLDREKQRQSRRIFNYFAA